MELEHVVGRLRLAREYLQLRYMNKVCSVIFVFCYVNLELHKYLYKIVIAIILLWQH